MDAPVPASSSGSHRVRVEPRRCVRCGPCRLERVRACRFEEVCHRVTVADCPECVGGLPADERDPILQSNAQLFCTYFCTYFGTQTAERTCGFRSNLRRAVPQALDHPPGIGRFSQQAHELDGERARFRVAGCLQLPQPRECVRTDCQ